MKKNGLRANFLLQFTYQILILGVPLIVSPYLTRTMGAVPLGVYSYSYSIAHYFVLAAMLGIARHGQRVIAEVVEDIIKLRETFWSLFLVHIIMSIIALASYIAFVRLFIHENQFIYYIQGIYVLSALFDITWLFYGLENFKSVVLKNTFVKLMELAFVFLFVKGPGDLWKYSLIMTLSICFGQAIMLPQAIKLVPPIRVSVKKARDHIKPLFLLGISVIAVTLYTVFDKTLLGLMLDMSSVSFYEYSNKIITVPKTLLGVISTVLFPRVCKIAEKGDRITLQNFFEKSVVVTAFFGCGITSLIIGISDTLAPIYFGDGFEICGPLMMSMAPLILIISLGDLVRTQLMIPKHKDTQFVVCLCINATVNIILSLIFIKIFGVFGAVIGTVSAELCGLILETYICHENIDLKKTIGSIIPFALSGAIMVAFIWIVKQIMEEGIGSLLLQIAIGCLIYLLLSISYFVYTKKVNLKKIVCVLKCRERK